MADSLESLLAGKRMSEPPEIAIIKQFVEAKFAVTPDIAISTQQITISVKGAALAGALRPYMNELKQLCSSPKRLVIRIQ